MVKLASMSINEEPFYWTAVNNNYTYSSIEQIDKYLDKYHSYEEEKQTRINNTIEYPLRYTYELGTSS